MTSFARLLGGCLLAAVIALPPPAHSDAPRSEAPRFEASAFAGYRFGGKFEIEIDDTGTTRDIDLRDGNGWGVGLGLYRDPTSLYEFLYSRQKTPLQRAFPVFGEVEVTTEYYHVGGTLLFEHEPWLHPWVSLTVGMTRFKADGFGSETDPSASLGAGLRFPFGARIAATLGFRGYLTLTKSDTGFFCASVEGEGVCLVQTTGHTVWQSEASAGLVIRF